MIQKVSLILTIILCMSGCSGTLPDACTNKNPAFVASPEGNQVRHGQEWKCYPNGSWASAKTWEYGTLQGKLIAWHRNGAKEREGNLKDGLGDGKWTYWHANGSIAKQGVERATKEGKDGLEGKWTFWYENGNKKNEGEYSDNERNGAWTGWHENGEKSWEGEYHNSAQFGMWTEWYKNGAKRREGEYSDGRTKYDVASESGMWTEWYKNGEKRSEGEYSDGSKNGTWTEWYENGAKRSEGEYRLRERTDFDRRAGLPATLQIGIWTEWYDNGNKKNEGEFLNGSRIGAWTEWYENGTMSGEGEYSNGSKIGTWTSWNENGTQERERDYDNDLMSLAFRDENDKPDEKPIILGSLDKTLIDEVVNRNIKKIKYCYEQELTKNPKLGGKVKIKFVISKSGSVAKSSVDYSSMNNKTVESCISSRVLRMQFPKPKGGGIVVVIYPFVFGS